MESPSIVLRTVRSKVIDAATAAELEEALNAWFRTGGNRTFLSAFQIAAFSMLILYADG